MILNMFNFDLDPEEKHFIQYLTPDKITDYSCYIIMSEEVQEKEKVYAKRRYTVHIHDEIMTF